MNALSIQGLAKRFDEVQAFSNVSVEVNEARRMRLSLEDVFVQVTGIEADAMKTEKEKGGGPR